MHIDIAKGFAVAYKREPNDGSLGMIADANWRRNFRRRMLRWFDAHARDLPWRRTSDPYRVWISEIMLQQTQVATVIPYYDRFIKRFPTAKVLAAASEEEVLRHWEGLG